MPLQLSKHAYLSTLSSDLNKPISLNVILKPFGLKASNLADPFILLGHFLEALAESKPELRSLDPLDVTGIAWELGHEESGQFLTTGPSALAEMHARSDTRYFPKSL